MTTSTLLPAGRRPLRTGRRSGANRRWVRVRPPSRRRLLPPIAAAGLIALVGCGRSAEELAAALGRPPSEWEAAGWRAARLARSLLEAPAEWASPGSTWRQRLPEPCLPERQASSQVSST